MLEDDGTNDLDPASASFDSGSNRLTIIVLADGNTAVSEIQTALNGVTTPSGASFTATSSQGNPSIPATAILFAAPDVSSLFNGLNFTTLLEGNPLLLLNGLDSLLGAIEDGLNSIASSVDLPLVGNGLSKAADFIGQFRSGLLAQLENDIKLAGGNVQSAIQKALWDVLGAPGLNILVSPTKVDPNTGLPVLLTIAQQIDVEFSAQNGLVVNLELSHEVQLVNTSGNPINVNIGVPGLNFTATGNVSVSIGYTVILSFGLNAKNGFYFKTPDSISLQFMADIPGLTFTGNLAFLQLQISDDPTDPSYFKGGFSITLNAPDGGNMITGAMLISGIDLSQVLQFNLSATANVNLVLVASFGGNTAFPTLDADFHLRWDWSAATGAGAPDVWFDNVGLDLGSFITGFLAPILTEVQTVTEPVQPIITIVTTPIPILSTLVGSPVTLLSLAQTFGLLDPGTVQFINELAQIVTLINDIHNLGSGDIVIPMGAFSLGYDNSGNLTQVATMTAATLNNLASQVQSAAADDPGASSSYTSGATSLASALSSTQGLSFPFIQNPSSLFNLFVGKDVTLVQWVMPEFKFEFTYTQVIPIFPPLDVEFGGIISATINFGFGYDTYGIREIFSDPTHNPADLLDGFFILTTDQNHKPVPALTLSGDIFAGAELDLGIISGGVQGGISATINFNWNDNSDNDGKLRFSEIAADAAEGPECIFDMTGSVNIFLDAFVSSFFFSKTWNFGNITLINFALSCPTPVLGSMSGGDLTLNIGSLASARQVGDTSDDSEDFIVRDQGASTGGGETVSVTFDNEENTFTGVTLITVQNPGQGNNVLDFRGVTAPVSVTSGPGNDTIYLSDAANSVVYCGSGNDTVICSSKATATGVVIYGGTGNDTITAGAASVVIFGGSGNNVITGSPGGDTIVGGGGNDIITAGGGDVIITGPGNNTVTVANGANAVNGTGAVHNFVLADSWLFVMGDISNASGLIGALSASSTPLAAAIWSDMTSTTQMELMSGSFTAAQKEAILVGQLDAILLQERYFDPNHQLFAAPSSLYSYLPSAMQAAYPNAQGQTLVELERTFMASSFSSYINPRVIGGGTDTVTGGADGDIIDGGAGNDVIYGGAGNDLLIAGAGSSQVYGAGGNDVIIGGEISMIDGTPVMPNNATVAPGSSVSSSNLTVLLGDVNSMLTSTASAPLNIQGLNGGGNDLLVGGGGSDALFGGAGNDALYGGNLLINGSNITYSTDGNNFIAGGQGNDTIFTDDASSDSPTPTPTGISIKSSIWFDAGSENMRLPTDSGFAGIVVTLYLASAPTTPVATTMTDASGNYEFDGLSPTSYIVGFSKPTDLNFVTVTGSGSSVSSDGKTGPIQLSLNETYTQASAGYQSATSPGIVSVSNTTATLSSSATTPMVFTVTLSSTLPYAVDVTYSTVDAAGPGGTVAALGSFGAISGGTLTFSAGQTSAQVTVQIAPSSTYGSNTQFELQVTSAELQNPTGAVGLTIANATGIGTIVNNNPIPTINITSFDPGNNSVLVTVGDVYNPSALAQALVNYADPVSTELHALYGGTPQWAAMAALQFSGASASSPQQIQAALLPVLNEIIQGQNIYYANPVDFSLPNAFTQVSLSLPTIELLAQSPAVGGQTLIALNRLILEDAYPNYIPGSAVLNPNFIASDFLNPAGLAAALAPPLSMTTPYSAVANYIWSHISSGDQAILSSPTTPVSVLTTTLESDLNALIAVASVNTASNALYAAAASDVTASTPFYSLSALSSFLAAQNPQVSNLALLNASIIRNALSAYLAPINTTIPTLNTGSFFVPGDFYNPSTFVTTLASSPFWSLIPTATQNVLMGVGSPSIAQISSALGSAVNGLLQNPVSLDTASTALTTFFGTVTKSDYTSYLESTNPQNNDLIRLNRFLLDDSYNKQLGQISGFEGTVETFTVTLSNPSVDTITVNWQTDIAVQLGGALEGDSAFPVGFPNVAGNYNPITNGIITFKPGVTSQVITVQTVCNNLAQDNLHYYVDLSNPVDATINQGHAFALISNLDPPVTVTFATISPGYLGNQFAGEILPGTVSETFTVELTAVSGQVVTVNYSTSPGTATDAPSPTVANPNPTPDYNTQTGTVIFLPGVTSQSITVTIRPTATAGEYFYVNLFNATNAVIAPNSGGPNPTSNHVEAYIGGLANGPLLPWSVFFSSPTYDVTESPTGDTTATITLYRTPGSPDPVAVFYTTNGTATADTANTTGDYVSVRQLVSFSGNQDILTVSITIHDDPHYDGNETVLLSLRNPTGGPVNGAPASAVLTIHDAAPPQLEIVQVAGPGGSAVTAGTTATFTVELVDSSGHLISAADNTQTIDFNYYTYDLTAITGADYAGIPFLPYSGQAIGSIGPGSSSTTISIATSTATSPAPTKNFGVVIDDPTNATVTTANSVTVGTIYNNVLAPVSGTVFYDANGNGVKDPGEVGLGGVTVEITYTDGSGTASETVTTNSQGVFSASVLLGDVSIQVQGGSITSPTGQSGQGASYKNTTNNVSQQINFTGTTGLDVFTPVGFTVTTSTTPNPATSKDTGTGFTNSTAFGGPGNDSITVGGGDDNIVGGSWENAVDANAPVNQISHDVEVDVVNSIWYIDPPTGNTSSIMGKVTNQGVNVVGQTVIAYDSLGDPVATATTGSDGSYTLGGLYVGGQYIVQFVPPVGDNLVLSGVTSTVIDNSKTNLISIASPSPVSESADYEPAPSNATPNYFGFHFGYSIYNVAENVSGGILAITIDRTNTASSAPVVVFTSDGTATAGTNYGSVSTVIEFAAGQATATLDIPIINTNHIGFDSPALTFTVYLYAPTGAPYDHTVVSIGGADNPQITDNDTIHAGPGVDVILGDSGYIPSTVNLLSSQNFGTISNIVPAGGSGNDTIYASTGVVYINGGLGNDTIYAGLVPVGTNPVVQQVIVGGSSTEYALSPNRMSPVVILTSSITSTDGRTLLFEDSST